jgi:hypothetical protein
MADAILCDRCDGRIDEQWNGPMFRIKNSTGTGGPRKWDLCPECHTEIRDELWSLLGYE